ncbi:MULTISPECIES: NAD(P)-dependent oxidoreductase [unclassified Parafrankia]|uniref:NAD-dependent epimerase/dehydratase family protein n=1 Tax=unclassified Parafrankia TaxID=2994368 RepID=UPI000DA5BC9A|nr:MULTISPECIES: NAD-dependent epimerase/dehydratase family protein [unclassified Parafrankia]TCJ33420.1 NAD-dependent epimerase/dehydratase family protein [Parafrankia sp. BMG5.11]SQD96510.1 NAD-dependent epimerase/dehydratase [Parafrankia sp. Ea1.12]
MKIAVTGGSGFIGGHVVDRLLDAGHEVLSLDLSTCRRPDPRAAYREIDVLELEALVDAFTGVDVVFHIAGMSNVDFAFADPVRTVRLNVEGTGKVCEAARRTGVRRVVFASTVWVYGAVADAPAQPTEQPPAQPPAQPTEQPSGLAAGSVPAPAGHGDHPRPAPLTEDAEIVLARAGHVYTSTKLAAELLLHSYQQTYGLPFTILRYGIPYGPGMRDELVLARFVHNAVHGRPLTVAGDGLQFRNYVYVRDLADAHVLALADSAANTTLALEGNEPVSVLEMAQAVQRHFPGTEIEHMPARPGDFRGREISAQRAAGLLGWRPTTPFLEGVRQYIEWYQANRQPPAVTAPSIGDLGVSATSSE